MDYVGGPRGSERVTAQLDLPEAVMEATLCYDVRFPEGFDFVQGGKLHGLGPANPVTGGRPMTPGGWSARVTFTEGGGAATYLYRQDKRGKFGATHRAPGFRFVPGRWHAVSLQVRANTPGEADGAARLYVDGELLVEDEAVPFRAAGADAGSGIRKLLFNTFHGGQSVRFAPRAEDGSFATETASFDNFAVHRGRFVRSAPGGEDWVDAELGAWRARFLLTSGGALASLRHGGGAELLDRADRGRLVQQSYYGAEDGSLWAGRPWRYNPVQGGEWRGRGGLVTAAELAPGESFRCTSIPRHWASGGLLEECEMRAGWCAEGPLLRARFRFEYRGEKGHPPRHQELPAVFFDRSLSTLVVPLPDGGGFDRREPGFPNEPVDWSAGWAAYVGADGRGLGVCVPAAEEATCYRFRDGGETDCSYLAPVKTFALAPGLSFEYEAYFAFGTPAEIAAAFAAVAEAR